MGHGFFLFQNLEPSFVYPFTNKPKHLQLSSPILTWKPVKGSQANSADPDQMPHNVASDQGLHCLLTGFSIKSRTKVTK